MVFEATEGLAERLAKEKVTVYIGFDPTAASLHIGSLLPIMVLAHLQRYGHTPVAIAGGGTGLIGDPSGKTEERKMLAPEQLEINLAGIKKQLASFLRFEGVPNPALIVNNADWLTTANLVDFLRDVGKHFTVNYLLAKESVRRRLEAERGISFTEFSYVLLQAFDFMTLFDRLNCTVQMGGSDQWGNITAGIDLIRSARGARVDGMVVPLLTTSNGTKFGKTEAGTVWLDPELTSPFRFYQYWLNTDDRDVVQYVKFFTFLSEDEVAALAQSVAAAPEQREAQRRLAQEVTRLVHGEAALARAERASRVLFGEEITGLNLGEVLEVFADVPSSEITGLNGGVPVVELMTLTGLAPSRSEARRLVQSGGVYINNRRVTDVAQVVGPEAAIGGQVIVLRKGQKQYHLVQVKQN